MHDLLAPAILGSTLAILLVYTALLPPTRLAFGVDRHPPQVILRGFYGNERNATGTYRWSKPEASLRIPVATPGGYRLALVLQDSPAAQSRRPVTIAVNGATIGTITPDDTQREYAFTHHLDARAWSAEGQRALLVEIFASPFIPPNDERALGVILSRVTVEPAPPIEVPWPALLGPPLALLVIAYAALRAGGLGPRPSAAILGAALAAYGVLALTSRQGALFLAYQPTVLPGAFLSLVLILAATPVLVRTAIRSPSASPASGGRWAADRAGAARFWSRQTLPLLPVVALAGGLRVYRADTLSLWLDEGATILFSQLPWRTVLGLGGQYDAHPPLYYAAVKLVSLAVPVGSAGRLLSIVTGTLTVAVLYALAARLLDRAVALGASVILAVSPLHIWHSREARMYAPVVFLIGVSYLALIAFHQGRQGQWAAVYGAATLLAVYVDYSALYALAPQLILLGLITRWHGRGALLLLGATLAAALAYLPWLPQILTNVATVGDRSVPLGATPTGVRNSVLAVIGLGGAGISGESSFPGAWNLWPAWRAALLLALVPVAVLGTVVVARRSALATTVAATLLIGTMGAAIVLSLISPGYAARTVMSAVLSWAILTGAATAVRQPAWLSAVAYASFACILVSSAMTHRAIAQGAYRQPYREVVAETAVAATFGKPIIALDILSSFMDAYAPQIAYGRRPALNALSAQRAGGADALWLVYNEYPWENQDGARDTLRALGYERIMHKDFQAPLYLDLFARPGARLGTAMSIDSGFATAGGWELPPAGAWLADDIGGYRLILANEGSRVVTASLQARAIPRTLYILEVEVQSRLQAGRPLTTLACLAADGATLTISSNEATAAPATGEAWQTVRTAVLCPAETAAVRLSLDNRGLGDVHFRGITLWEAIGRAEESSRESRVDDRAWHSPGTRP